MLSAVYREPAFAQEVNLREGVRCSASQQSEFIKALQACDLEKILKLLEKGEVNFCEMVVPTDELAKRLFSINEKKHFILYPEEERVKLEDFSNDCRMQAWMLISIFSDGTKDNDLKTQIFSKMKGIVGDDYEKKHQELSDEIKRKRGSLNNSPIREVFNESYQRQVDVLAIEDKKLIEKLNKKEE